MKIIFDLDGTLICSKARLYNLFSDLVQTKKLSFSTYWAMKYDGFNNQDILKNVFGYTAADVDDFVVRWMASIEEDSYLSMDFLIGDVKFFLQELSEDNELYLCTARQSTSQVYKQLKKLGINSFFKKIYVTQQSISKVQLIKNSGLSLGDGDWVIGDTGHDVLMGKTLNIRTCAVLSGFMSEQNLKLYNPDKILSDVTFFRG